MRIIYQKDHFELFKRIKFKAVIWSTRPAKLSSQVSHATGHRFTYQGRSRSELFWILKLRPTHMCHIYSYALRVSDSKVIGPIIQHRLLIFDLCSLGTALSSVYSRPLLTENALFFQLLVPLTGPIVDFPPRVCTLPGTSIKRASERRPLLLSAFW